MKKVLAIDTEFERKHTYRPILSIVQVREENKEPIIYDVFKTQDEKLVELIDLLINDENIKIIHSAKQDIEAIYYRFHHLAIKNVFDTQIAHKVLTGENEIGYSKAVEFYCKKIINKEKALQNSNWLQRPLSEKQIFYAKQDVLYLHDIFNITLSQLKSNAKNEDIFNKLCETITNENNYKYKPDCFWKKIEKKYRRNSNFHILKNMFIFREQIAFKLNLPREFVIRTNDLIEFVKTGNNIFLKTHKKVRKDAFIEKLKIY